MCKPTDLLCRKPAFSFDALASTLPYNPLPVHVAEDILGRTGSSQPTHLSRVLFIPKHDNATTHLPVYEFTDPYRRATAGASLGSNKYKINLMYMDRPRGYGTDADVCFFVDVSADKSTVTIEERSMGLTGGATATFTLPTEQTGHSVLTYSGMDASYAQAALSLDPGVPADGTQYVGAKARHYPTLTVKLAGRAEIWWKVQPNDYGGVCYHLLERVEREGPGAAAGGGEDAGFRLRAIYHHAGAHLYHPLDYSEGVLLLPEVRDSKCDAVSLALVILLLWHVRNLDGQKERTALSKIFGRLGIK